MKILFVCSENIYRSSTGHIIMQKIIDDNNLDWQVDSCGTSDFHNGEAPNISIQKVAKK